MSDTPAGNGNLAVILLTTCDQVVITGNVQPFQASRIMYLVAACDWGRQPEDITKPLIWAGDHART